MASSFLSLTPHLFISPTPRPTTPPNPCHHTQFLASSHHKPFLRGSSCVARLGFNPGPSFPDPDGSEAVISDLFDRAQGLLYTIADAAVSASDSVNGAKQNSDWLSGIANTMETVLKVLKDGLSYLHVPYAYGFAIILLTVLVKAATFPLSKKQVESTMAMRSLQPQIKAIQQRYAGDQERIQLETARLYKLAGINPLAGCLPTLATIPVWIGLYRALSNVADEGLLTEGFFWIPSLSGPTTIAARQSGSGISWLFPFMDGHPPLGWSDTFAYLVLPTSLVVLQYISMQSMQSSQNNDPNLKNSQALTKFLPLMIGYFALSVPSGLSLYWLTNNILSTAQQVWLQKLGGAKNPVRLSNDELTKDELPQTQKPLFETNPTKNETQQKEKLTSQGPQPGERFKQIKEQEARRRQEREEEKRKAEVVTANGIQIKSEGDQKEPNLAERAAGDGAESVDGMNEHVHSVSAICDSSNIGVSGVNGDLSTRDSNGELSSNCKVDGREEHNSHEILEKEKTVEAYTSKPPTDTELSGEDTNQAREEQLAGRED